MAVLDGPARGRVQGVAALVGQLGVHSRFSSPAGVRDASHRPAGRIRTLTDSASAKLSLFHSMRPSGPFSRRGRRRRGRTLRPMSHDVLNPTPEYLAFWRERHVCTLTTPRPDGTPHVVPVGVTYDPQAGLARVISNKHSKKVRNVLAAAGGGARVAVCQMEGRRWATLEGRAVIRTDEAAVAEAVARYAERYGRMPSPNPDRVVLEITLDRAMGRA
ncbi:nitrilase/cyanide hydratase and apolipoprotein N-acyltransferase [Streptomyces sp. C]|nr:nitrilase/cyanide hydratase and apolipoprotein N-acyltransferase [Streptomyces sp. C]